MAKPVLDTKLWEIVEPLLPRAKKRRRRYAGRKPLDNRKVLCEILFVLKTGRPWEGFALKVELFRKWMRQQSLLATPFGGLT